MAKLTKLQITLLQAAAVDSDGRFPKPVTQKDEAAVASLIKQGLALTIAKGRQEPRTIITEDGRASLPQPEQPPAGVADEPEAAPPPSAVRGKLGIVVEMLRRPQGAAISERVEATGWQAHSVRGAISGAIKKRLGLTVRSTAAEGGRVYRIAEQAA